MCKRVERICQVDPEGWYAPVIGEEVIRCKDCKHAQKFFLKNLPWMTQWEYSCRYFNTHSVMGDDFCSRGERAEE